MTHQPIRIALVVGEASGDLLAAHLIRALKRYVPQAEFYGIGGPQMIAEGFQALWPAELLSVHGYAEALRRYRELSSMRKAFLQQLLDHPPSVFIGVDAPDFNLWLEKRVKEAGIPSIHYVSPSIWAWRGGRIHKIGAAVSRVLCLFPFEPALYEAQGIPVSYVGHPLADMLPLEPDRAAAREQWGIPQDIPVFAVLPGSRQSEMRNLGGPFIGAMHRLQQRYPQAQFIVPFATPQTRALFEAELARQGAHGLNLRCVDGGSVNSHQAMTACDVVLVASGTATLEAALLKRPLVMAYRMGGLSWQLMRRMAYLPYHSLPNILAGRFVVPEFLQDEVTADNLAQALANAYEDRDTTARLQAVFRDIHLQLRQNTAEKAAQAVLPYLQA